MILINLLPHREEKRKRRKAAYFTGLALGAVAGLLVAGLWYGVLEQMKSAQMERNAFLGAEIKKLEAQIKDIANLRAEIDALKARQKAVEDLQTDRNIPVHLLNELVKQTPEGRLLNSIRQTGKVVAVTRCRAKQRACLRVPAQYAVQLARGSKSRSWSRSRPVARSRQAAARTYDFSMRVSIKVPRRPRSPAAKPGSVAAAVKAP